MNRLGRTMFKYVLLPLMAVFAPIVPMLITTIVLIMIDLISGVIAAKKRGEKIESAALRRTITKLFVYNSAIVTGHLVESYMLQNSLPIVKLVAGIISVTEMTSIFENLNSIYGMNLFKKIIYLLGSPNDPKSKS